MKWHEVAFYTIIVWFTWNIFIPSMVAFALFIAAGVSALCGKKWLDD